MADRKKTVQLDKSKKETILRDLNTYINIDKIGKDTLKIEGELGLERFWSFLMVTSFFAFLVCVFGYFEVKEAMYLPLFLTAMIFLLSFVLSKLTDNYHIVDFKRKILIYHRQFIFKNKIPICNFSQIQGIGVDGRVISNSLQEWSYRLAIVLKNGEIIPLNGHAIYTFADCMEIADTLAEMMDVEFIEGKEDHTFEVKRSQRKRNKIIFKDKYFQFENIFYTVYFIFLIFGLSAYLLYFDV